MTIEEWAKDFKSYVNALDIPRDDYNGIMEYIDEAFILLKEQETIIEQYRRADEFLAAHDWKWEGQ